MIRALHPFTLLGVALLLSIAVVAWLNPVSSLFALAAWGAIAAMTIGLRPLWHPSTLVILVAAMTAGMSMALYGQPSGTSWWEFGPAHITDGSLLIAGTTGLRVLALALPSVMVFRALDLTHFADALEQTAHVPARLVWGSFAGLRQLELARSDWRVVQLARRARGQHSGNPLQRFASALFAVFVLATERGGELAITMDSRGLATGARVPSRPIRWHTRDTVLLGIGLLAASLTGWIALSTGGSIA